MLVGSMVLMVLLSIIIVVVVYIVSSSKRLPKIIWICWLQGWDQAPWIARECAESWRIHNPGWEVRRVSRDTLSQYGISMEKLNEPGVMPAHKADLVRLRLLERHGGVWADATLLCMTPLDAWIHRAVQPAGFWSYHGRTGHGEGTSTWFLACVPRSLIVREWRRTFEAYWKDRSASGDYYALDKGFVDMLTENTACKASWERVPYLDADGFGSPHTIIGRLNKIASPKILDLFENNPPHIVKLQRRDVPPEKKDVKENTNLHTAIETSRSRALSF